MILGRVGESIEIIDKNGSIEKYQDCIEMAERRPSPEHIATEDGEWTIKDEVTE